jgi:hypothetical protein
MSSPSRDGRSVIGHAARCVLCGRELHRRGTGRRRLYCGGSCRQRAYRLREQARREREAGTAGVDPREVARLLALALRSTRR